MEIGPYTIDPLDTGGFALDGGAMFGIVPRPLWERKIVPDDSNRIALRGRALLIRGVVSGARKVILVDTGMGTKWNARQQSIYGINPPPQAMPALLAPYGLTPADITDVIMTHLHFDHAGGATTYDNNLNAIPTFPKATYYVQRTHLEWAHHPTAKDRGSFIEADFIPLLKQKQLVTLNGEIELFPDIRLRLSQGHTTGMQHPIITDGQTTLFFCADLLPTSAHLSAPWIMAYDLRPLVTLEEKQALLHEAMDGNWILAFGHCPLMTASTLTSTSKGYDPVALKL